MKKVTSPLVSTNIATTQYLLHFILHAFLVNIFIYL